MLNPYRSLLRIAQLSLLLGSCYLAALVTGDLTRIWGPSKTYLAPATTSKMTSLDEAKLLHPTQISLMASTTQRGQHTKGTHKGKTDTQPTPRKYKRCDPNAPMMVSHIRWLLKGTAVAEPASYSSAAIYDYKRHKSVHVYVGQAYQGVMICAISARSIHISRGAGREELLVMGVSPRRLPQWRRRWISIRSKRSHRSRWRRRGKRSRGYWRRRWRKQRWRRHYKQLLSSIQRHSRDHYAMPRRWIRPLARHYRFLQKQATILPYFQRGKAVGMRIIRPKSNSIFHKLGLKNGDIIQSVNGVPLSDPQRVIKAYYELRGASDFSVQIYRNGRHHTVRYSLVS